MKIGLWLAVGAPDKASFRQRTDLNPLLPRCTPWQE